ncbi:syndecan-4 [Chanos chanos]|uniref:Syndecan n=1 Tax=Chanos chanos TaxID=29144 RepID=A0A6J2VQU1_CHACN|nr:syndecan-4 [Chanos chanos]
MRTLYLVLFLFAAVYAESARETETWVSTDQYDQESSGDFSFGETDTTDDEDLDPNDDDDDDDDYNDYDDMSGSGDDSAIESNSELVPPFKPDLTDNRIPEDPIMPKHDLKPDDSDLVQKNEVGLAKDLKHGMQSPNVQMAVAGSENIFNKTEVLAAVIAGCVVGVLFAAMLILFLVYRMKKKDEGSYDLGKKPIYKKAPTAEIYA